MKLFVVRRLKLQFSYNKKMFRFFLFDLVRVCSAVTGAFAPDFFAIYTQRYDLLRFAAATVGYWWCACWRRQRFRFYVSLVRSNHKSYQRHLWDFAHAPNETSDRIVLTRFVSFGNREGAKSDRVNVATFCSLLLLFNHSNRISLNRFQTAFCGTRFHIISA